MSVDPKITFWLGVAVTIATAIGGGTVTLTNLIPADWIPFVTGWTNLIAFVGTAILTALTGISSNKAGPFVR